MKIGDRVVALKDSLPWIHKGDTGTITVVDIDGTAKVQWEDNRVGDGQWWINLNHIALTSKIKVIGVATICTTYSSGEVLIQYHDTIVAKRTASGAVILDSGGWRTQTTKKRINAALDKWAHGWQVYQKDFQWYLSNLRLGHEVTFKDGITISVRGDEWVISVLGIGSSFPMEAK